MKLDQKYIKSLPLTTNKINVTLKREPFFSRYSIVSYYGTDKEHRNLAYEHLAELPCLSVTGIRARWSEIQKPTTLFFVLTAKGKESEILNSLRAYEHIRSKIDTLEEYDDSIQKRIVASLAINSLGKKRNDKMMYNDGSLLICDDKNFNVPKSRKELVCLKIEINEYMILNAKTSSFSNPSSYNELRKRNNCVFRVGRDIGGCLWEGQSVKPIVIKDFKDGDYNLKELYVQKKRFSDNKNNVPYWPYNKENYTHGKLFVIWQVVQSVNKDFDGLVEIDFCDFDILHYDECRTGGDMLSFLKDYLSGRTIHIEDPFGTAASKKLIDEFKNEAQTLMEDKLIFPKKASGNDMVIKLCEPKEDAARYTHYTKSLYRMAHSGNALQHITFYGNEKDDKISKVSARRILIELFVKDSLINRRMPKQFSELITDWVFYRYKINEGFVHGASLAVNITGTMSIQEYGLSQNCLGEDFEQFVHENLKYNDYDKIRGGRDYMAMEKNGNVFLIIDTDEIPILDANLIDEGYGKVVNECETISMFKRKGVAHEYLRGYIGFHLWKSDGIDGEANASYSYISGTNSENMQIMQNTKMDKMPRARRIFILNKENPKNVENNIMEIAAMLKFSFGRWNELMAYPFPFKFLQEYLDDACETVFSKHWSEITFRGDLCTFISTIEQQ
jgi:hypothetical protein